MDNSTLIGNKFVAEKMIGQGSFGQIYQGSNIHTGEVVAIKMESAQTKHPQLIYESKVIKFLQGGLGIPEVHWCGSQQTHNLMVIDMLGPSLEDLFNFSSRKFSLKTVLMILDQVLSRIQYIHHKNYIHRDIKPDNFLIGRHKRCMVIYAIDFGLAKRFKDQKGNHIQFRDQRSLTGTARYASVNAHLGREQSRRDDLEAIFYMIVYFLKGSLPWQGLNAKTREEKYRQISDKKKSTKSEDLCSGLPSEFLMYLNYVKHLAFKDEPDYKKLRRSFRELFIKNEYLYDYEYDWKALNHTACKHQDEIIEPDDEEEKEDKEENEEKEIIEKNKQQTENNDSPIDDEEVKNEMMVDEFLRKRSPESKKSTSKKCSVF